MLFKEFKTFAFKGNLIDMAVGIIIGSAFGLVVKSLVDNVFMPPLGILTGRVNFTGKFLALDGKQYETLEIARKASAPVLTYGQFITDLIAFLITAFAVFLVVKKFIGSLLIHAEKAPAALTADQQLLTEIRDLLKQKEEEAGRLGG